MKLANGEAVVFRAATCADYPAISHLIQNNFAKDTNYAQLSEQARAAYIEANSVAGLTEACSHPDNVLCLVATSETGSITGVALYRRARHLLTNEIVADGKRVQIAGSMQSKGLGRLLLHVVRQHLRTMGFRKMVGYISSASPSFFEQQGCASLMVVDNPGLAKLGVKTQTTYVEWLL